MSVIAVKGIPIKWSLKSTMFNLAKIINGYFEVLNFSNVKLGVEDCYIRLPPTLNPMVVVDNINNSKNKFKAFIPDRVPNVKMIGKPKKVSRKIRRKLNIKVEGVPHGILKTTHANIMTEMQYKYPGLHSLIIKSNKKIYEELSKVVHARLLHVLETNPDSRDKCFVLSKFYRRSHPHFADFQLILSTLHEYEQSVGLPRSEITEKSLSTFKVTHREINEIPPGRLKTARSKYSKQITNKVIEHIKDLDVTPDANDTEEDVVRKKVRTEFKKMMPFIPEMINQVITNNLVVPSPKLIKILVYGEPFLPNKEVIKPFLKKYHAQKIMRSKFMHNLIGFEVASKDYEKLMADDGILLDCGAKLFMRPTNIPIIKNKLNASKGNKPTKQELELDEEDEPMDENVDEELY